MKDSTNKNYATQDTLMSLTPINYIPPIEIDIPTITLTVSLPPKKLYIGEQISQHDLTTGQLEELEYITSSFKYECFKNEHLEFYKNNRELVNYFAQQKGISFNTNTVDFLITKDYFKHTGIAKSLKGSNLEVLPNELILEITSYLKLSDIHYPSNESDSKLTGLDSEITDSL